MLYSDDPEGRIHADNYRRHVCATRGKVSTLATLNKPAAGGPYEATLDRPVAGGLAVSPDDAYVVWSQMDRNTFDLMLVEGFQ